MLKNLVLIISIIFLISCTSDTAEISKNLEKEAKNMNIRSPNFKNNDEIPLKFTCFGENINPELIISEIPENTKSLVLIVDDPDAPGKTWIHWVLFNIFPTNHIHEDSVPKGAIQGKNSWGNNEYGGPCPPSGKHRYFFKIYALNSKLNLDPSASKNDVENAMKDKILAKAQLIGISTKISTKNE